MDSSNTAFGVKCLENGVEDILGPKSTRVRGCWCLSQSKRKEKGYFELFVQSKRCLCSGSTFSGDFSVKFFASLEAWVLVRIAMTRNQQGLAGAPSNETRYRIQDNKHDGLNPSDVATGVEGLWWRRYVLLAGKCRLDNVNITSTVAGVSRSIAGRNDAISSPQTMSMSLENGEDHGQARRSSRFGRVTGT